MIKRKLSEIIVKYKLEPSLMDIYTEGIDDKNIVKLYFDEYKIYNVNIIPIDDIDFSEDDLNLFSNREKVIHLSQKLAEIKDSNINNVTCVVDNDFDVLEEQIQENKYLLRTDFANLEMYLFQENIIEKFIKLGLGNFPMSSLEVEQTLTPLLIHLYAIRYARTKIDVSYKLLKPDKIFKVINSIPTYDLSEILKKFLSKNSAINKEADFKKIISEVNSKVSEINERRMFIHGKDFVELFYLLIKKLKNTYTYNDKTFERSLFSSIEIKDLVKFGLFEKLQLKYLDT